ncbi:hypothetical protein ACFL0E_00115 [Nanoarchaeota archaeon]
MVKLGKKGSLNLSIQAIVIIVIAFVILGLGLSFVRSQFKSMEETSSSVQDQIKEQILDDLRTGNKKLSFPTTEIKMSTSASKVIAVGIKNTKDKTLNFKISFEDLSTGTKCTGAGIDTPSTTPSASCASFFWDNSVLTLSAGEANVYSIKYFSPSKQGSYLHKMVINDQDSTATNKEYASRNFFVTTTS